MELTVLRLGLLLKLIYVLFRSRSPSRKCAYVQKVRFGLKSRKKDVIPALELQHWAPSRTYEPKTWAAHSSLSPSCRRNSLIGRRLRSQAGGLQGPICSLSQNQPREAFYCRPLIFVESFMTLCNWLHGTSTGQ